MSYHKKLKRCFILLVILIFTLIFASCEVTDTNSPGQQQPSASANNKNKETEKEEAPKEFYEVGEEAITDGTSITVTKFEKSSGSDFDKPKDGMEYVIVTVKIKNKGSENISYNPYDYSMQNSKGQITDSAFTMVNTDTSLSSGDLASDGEIEGTIAFEQPKDDGGLILLYKENMFSDKTKFKFKLNK